MCVFFSFLIGEPIHLYEDPFHEIRQTLRHPLAQPAHGPLLYTYSLCIYMHVYQCLHYRISPCM